jgi:type IV pilus assembly protein PilM
MATGNAVWGIEVGQCALKAIKLRDAGDGQVELVAFDVIEHPKILSQPDADADELIKAALEKFVSRNDWQGDRFVIGVPGQQTFARFCKLPPVDEKKIPDIVRFEASQQIPFDMDDVVWDYEVFKAKDSPDVEVGIFAMRKDLVRKQIEYYSQWGISPAAIQTIPSALYNFCRADGQTGEDRATVIIDVGAQNTDLVIVEPNSAWTRNIPLGGNAFTEALVKAFKLSFAKAESLKRTGAASKHARLIFQAMRPVFAELVAEIQRSIGFYSSTHRDVELTRVLACGNAFRLPGLQKYLENNLTISGGVHKLEKFQRIIPSATSNAPQFTDNVLGFGVSYGLALQGLGLVPIKASLLPTELARVAMWQKKRPYFVAAAACLGLAAALPWTRNFLDSRALAANADLSQRAQSIVQRAAQFRQDFSKVQSDSGDQQKRIEELLSLMKDQPLVPRILSLVHEALPQDERLAKVRTPDDLKKLVEAEKGRVPRTQRKQLWIENLKVEYSKDIEEFTPQAGGSSGGGGGGGGRGGARFGGEGGGPRFAGEAGDDEVPVEQPGADAGPPKNPGFYVRIDGRMTYGQDQPKAFSLITDEFYKNLQTLGNRAGLGFWIPESDPKGQDQKNFGQPLVTKYYKETTAAPVVFDPRPGAGRPSEPTPTPENDPTLALYADPVTGEDTRTDWRFSFGFKIKLGEKPAEGEPKPEPTP